MASIHGTSSDIDRTALLRVVEPVVHAHGAELVDLEFRPERGGWVLRLFVEKAGSADRKLSTRDAAVDLDLCAGISRDLSPALDVADVVPHAYHLEVSSPGLERPLRNPKDFERFAGERAKLKLREPVAGRRVIVGVLRGYEVGGGAAANETDGRVIVDDSGRKLEVALSNVDSARLVFEFGAAARSRPSGPPPRRGGLAKRH
jgi:ribosome maturation factor RimP